MKRAAGQRPRPQADPGACTVRALSYRLAGSDERFTLVTTLLDPAAALAALCHERWEIETAYDEVKTHLLGPGAQLRSKTPDLVMQEFDGLMLAHYAVRYLIQEAADLAGEDPTDYPSCMPSTSSAAGSSIPAVFPRCQPHRRLTPASSTRSWRSAPSPAAAR